MLLAAGRGERLRPYTDTIPKPLLRVHGKPLILHHIEALQAVGFSELVINVSWLGQMIQEELGDGSSLGVTIEYSPEEEALETAGGIVQALPLLGERFLVANADIYTDFDFSRLQGIKTDAHLVLVANPGHNREGDFGLSHSLVTNEGNPIYTFSGIACYHRNFFKGLAAGKQPLAPLLRKAAEQQRVSGELHRGEWTDVGTVERWQALG